MTAYDDFVANPILEPGQVSKLWELEVHQNINNMLDFLTDFLAQRGYYRTDIIKDDYIPCAIFNNKWVWYGAIQDGNKIALRLVSKA